MVGLSDPHLRWGYVVKYVTVALKLKLLFKWLVSKEPIDVLEVPETK